MHVLHGLSKDQRTCILMKNAQVFYWLFLGLFNILRLGTLVKMRFEGIFNSEYTLWCNL
jgi:hypothetical protein